MEHRQVLNFLALCEERNFTRAAEKQHITQQGLSWSIRELEKELGMTLFVRSRRSAVSLTEYGTSLESAAKVYTNQHDYIVETLLAQKEQSESRLNICMIDGISSLFPPGFWGEFVDSNPDIFLSVKTFPADICQQQALEQHLHIAFSFHPFDTDQFEALLLRRKRIGLIVGEKHHCQQVKKTGNKKVR